MAEEKDTAAPAKRTTGKTGRRKKPEAEHAARAAPQDKDTGSKAQEILEQARTEPKPEWEVAEQVVLLPLDRLRPFKNHPFKVSDEDELMQDTIDSIMAGGVINPILVRPAEDGKFEVVSGHRRFRASELAGKADIKAIVREMDDDMQKVVGGYIQEAPFFRDPVTLVCNEEGKISGLPLNRAIRDDDGKIIDVVAGTFFICGAEGDHFSSIPKELQKKYEEKFKKPEAFLKMGRSIMAIPTEPTSANPKPDRKAPGMEL